MISLLLISIYHRILHHYSTCTLIFHAVFISVPYRTVSKLFLNSGKVKGKGKGIPVL